MTVISSIPVMQTLATRLHQQKKKIIFVPTMGALHEGHLRLVRRARRLAGRKGKVVVSIFVNPTQFNSPSDLKHYPRTMKRDLSLLRKEKTDIVFTPTASQMYPEGCQSWVEVGALARPLCGASRPGHFRGVATVVSKLFHIVQPDIALFGEKDFQQLAIILRMVADLNLPIRIVGHPTVREANGLAMSSRNARLSTEGRKKARCLHEALQQAKKQVRQGTREGASLKHAARNMIGKCGRVEYIEIVDERTLQPVKRVQGPCRMALAVFVEGVRLIDNASLRP